MLNIDLQVLLILFPLDKHGRGKERQEHVNDYMCMCVCARACNAIVVCEKLSLL